MHLLIITRSTNEPIMDLPASLRNGPLGPSPDPATFRIDMRSPSIAKSGSMGGQGMFFARTPLMPFRASYVELTYLCPEHPNILGQVRWGSSWNSDLRSFGDPQGHRQIL